MWRRYEPVHDVIYFAPEVRAAADALGMRGFWMGYFAMRAAPFGACGPDLATATFYGFHPSRAARVLPEAWGHADPARVLAARLAGAGAALTRLWGPEVLASPELAEAADLAWVAAAGAGCAGRPLAAANQALPRPAEPHLALWQAASTLREHRGDGHNAVLVAHGVGPVAAHVLKVAAGESEAEALRLGRSWSEPAWAAAVDELRGAGLLDERGGLTPDGEALRARVETATDAAAVQPWAALGAPGTARLAELLGPLADAVLDSGTIPFPNPLGLAREG